MPAVLTHKTIMLLARDRIRDIRDRISTKLAVGGNVTDLEHRIGYLADKAYAMMTDNSVADPAIDYPTDAAYATPLGQGVSPFAVMGSMGPDITGFSAILAPGNSWVFDTIHKGNPDQNREPVVARTTDFILEFWRQVSSAIDSRAGATNDDKEKARAQMRAYVMGHLCHITGDVISHPFINDLEWHLGVGSRDKFSHSGGEGSIDAKVARQVLRRASTREGQSWSVWWPTVDTVPQEFFSAYDATLEQIFNARTSRPAGFGAFEEEFKKLAPPSLTVDFVRDGYAVYRNGILTMGYGWGYWHWWAFLMPAMLPLMALFPLSLALPKGRDFLSHSPTNVSGDRPFSEVLTLPLAISSIVPAFYGIWVASLTTRGVEALSIGGVTTSILSAISAVVFFATLAVEDLPWWLRWLLTFGIPLGSGLFFAITWLANQGTGEGGRRALSLIYMFPFLLAVAFGALYFLAVGIPPLIGGGDTPLATEVTFGILTGLFIVAVGVAWFILPKKMRDARIPEEPKPFPAERPHLVRLFDDTSLYNDPAQAAATLAQRFFPSARRPLLKLWWEGTGKMFVRSRRFKLEFSFTGNAGPDQVVPAPIAPMKAVEFAHFLTATVKDSGGATGKLKAAMVYNTDLDYELPPGATFADEGDPDEENAPSDFTTLNHDEAAEKFHQLGATQDSTDYVLCTAPKSAQAIGFGRNGPVPFELRESGASGLGTVTSSGVHVTGVGTAFRNFFIAGDQIGAKGQARTVMLVRTNSELVISSPFSADLPSGTAYTRIEPDRERDEGYTYVAQPTSSLSSGDTIMDAAADIGAMLCLGVTPHLLKSTELNVPTLAGKVDAAGNPANQNVGKVYQVFRNWSLDRRRVNEWRMLVAGGARGEKFEAPDGYDSAMTQPRDPAWAAPAAVIAQGEQTALARGWARLLREWYQVAAQPGQNAINPTLNAAGATAPNNLELSRAISFLFDMPDPVVVH